MAGYWNRSQSQIQDTNGKPIAGARAYFYAGGTTTPIEVFKDYDLATPHPNPLLADGNGFFPDVFFDEADGFYRIRVTTALGVLLYDSASIPIIGPSGGGGGGSPSPVDPDGTLKTGDMLIRYDTGLRTGFVRGNGRSIGSAISGATERANADTQPLYEYLWNGDPTLVVLGGRGGSAAADWSANKPLTLPDYRGRALVGLDTMGNIAANVLPAAAALSWADGEATHQLVITEMPLHDHGGATGQGGGHRHKTFVNEKETFGTPTADSSPMPYAVVSGGTDGSIFFSTDEPTVGRTDAVPPFSLSIAGQGGGAAHNNIQPSKGVTLYIRL